MKRDSGSPLIKSDQDSAISAVDLNTKNFTRTADTSKKRKF